MTPGIRPSLCLVSATETRTRYDREKLQRRAVDFRSGLGVKWDGKGGEECEGAIWIVATQNRAPNRQWSPGWLDVPRETPDVAGVVDRVHYPLTVAWWLP